MNDGHDDLNRLIDRLVDDELDGVARRELLARLADEPDGWRRCASAFLEAQCWRAGLSPLAARPAPERDEPRIVLAPLRKTTWSWPRLAACLFAAFLLGWSARGGPAHREAPLVIRKSPFDGSPVVTHNEHQPEPFAAVHPAPEPPTIDTEAQVDDSALPDLVRRRLQQRGFQVEQQKHVVAMELKNGERLRIPVEEVKLRYVGDRTY